ncbi:FG-GAP-like repeat-containing protein [Hymenobacter lucidus]|uniref:T9SS type A sorting domain-containing protein n=1 Tax=Hymenobacter lucidus TaxID=2880930 RepID=A0ABS8ATE9_9BACT|nr:FG-GAP-like repeat-containing protein [Hymenobacter lucidus]MCB2409492.1 T9SS type A sorting domain-containing protein [Hymenobacter lucidus]
MRPQLVRHWSKSFLLLILAFLSSYGSYAQLPGWASGQVLFSTFTPQTIKCLTDPNGDLIVYGTGGSITFGTLPAVSGLYVAKMKASTRQWQWAVQANSLQMSNTSATVDSNGNVVVGGTFYGSATFGSLPLVPGGDRYTSYLAVISGSAGQWLWAKSTPNFSVKALAADASGGVIVSGPLFDDVVFSNLPVVRAYTRADSYVARMTTITGEWQWVKQITPTAANSSTQIFPTVAAWTTSGEFIVAGTFSGTYPFGSSATLTSKPNIFEFYIASLDTNTGQWRWATQSETANGQSSNPVINLVVSGNDILIGGKASVNTSFGSSFTTGSSSTYLGRLDRMSGAWQWFGTIPGSSANISSITPTAAGYVVVGTFTGRLPFSASNVLTSAGNTDIFVAGLNNADQWQWATRGGGINKEVSTGGTVLGSGEIVVAGSYSPRNRTELSPQLSLSHSSTFGNESFFLASLNSTSFLLNDISPYLNAPGVVPASAVVATFNQSIAPTTATNLRVSSSLSQGRRTGTLVLSSSGNATNNVISFQPTLPFLPNELVSVSIPRTIRSLTQQDIAPFLYQFRTAAGGSGRGLLTGTDSLSGARTADFARCADMDNDGDLDLVTSGATGSSIQVSFNDGTGHFPRIATIASTGTVAGLALEDIDGDSDIDVTYTALHAAAPDSAIVQFNTGAGTFSGRSAVAVGENPRGLCFGDLDADGDADLVIANANASGTLSIRLNDGTGRFTGTTTIPTGSSTRSVAIGDLDNDGDLDIVGANEGSNTVSVAYNNGAGGFGIPVSVATGPAPHTVVLGDLNADNTLDIATAGQGGSKAITLLLTSTFSGQEYAPTNYAAPDASAIELADLDADQDLDILVLDKANRVVRPLVCFRPGDFGGAPAVRVNLLPETLLVGDLDGDSDLDMVTVNRTGSLSPRFNTGLVTAVVAGSKAGPPAAVYPVPAHDHLTVQLQPGTGSTSLTLFNTLGQQVLARLAQLPAADGTLQVPLSSLRPGMYHLRISTPKGTSVQHVVIE